MARLLSRTFKSLKPHSNSRPTHLPFANPTEKSRKPSQILPPSSSINPSSSESPSISGSSSRNSWAVYLILSTNSPIKTYVGVTNNFSRRLKQHNGEVRGGAKASRAGRPWICACLIKGFQDKSKAYEFESKWKSFSRKLPRKRSSKNLENADNPQILLLQHRYASLNQVKDVIDCSHLEIDWRLDPM
ncbi:structure-specific endonuclease subunit SLX1 isoform X2 [Sesamum indicum]|nr:structure-specific endonuclease subunit SLX1 isoform X2 [Sesamum indicum]